MPRSIEKNTAGGCHNYKKGANPLQFLDNPAVAVVATSKTNINIILKQVASDFRVVFGSFSILRILKVSSLPASICWKEKRTLNYLDAQ